MATCERSQVSRLTTYPHPLALPATIATMTRPVSLQPDTTGPAHPRLARIGSAARWTLAVLACLWLALCTAVGPLYWDFDNGTIAHWNWTNTAIFAGSFIVYLGIVVALVRFAALGHMLPKPLHQWLCRVQRIVCSLFGDREVTSAVADNAVPAHDATDSTIPTGTNPGNRQSDANGSTGSATAHASRIRAILPVAGRAIMHAVAFLDRWIVRGTNRFWKLALVFFIGWLWVPTTLLAAFGADIRSQIREFSWAWNQWTGLKQPYIGFFSFVPMDIYPTAHYMWPSDPTYLTDQHNIVLTLIYGATAAFSRYVTGSNDAGIVVLAALQMLFAVFCCASAAHRFLNRPWMRTDARSSATNEGPGESTGAGPHPSATPSTTPSATPQYAGGLARVLILLFFMVCPLAVFSTISLTKSPLFAFAFVWWFGVWYELTQTWRPAGRRRGGRLHSIAKTDVGADIGNANEAISDAKDNNTNHSNADESHVAPSHLTSAHSPVALVRLPRHSLIALILSSCVMLISAKYAWYILALQFVLALIADRRRWSTYVAALLIPTVLIHGGIALAIQSHVIIGGDPIESRGVQLQMIARVAQRNPDGISADASKNLSPVFNQDQMADAYFQQDADPVKSSGIQAKKVSYKWRTVTPEDMEKFNKAWLDIVMDNPVIALDALLAKCFGYFNVTDQPYVSMGYYINSDYVQKHSTWIKSYHHDWREKVAGFATAWGSIPVLGWFTHGNFSVVLTLLFGAAEVVRRRWLTLMTHIPLLLLMGVMITAPANNFERHMLPVAFVFGFVVLSYWRESRSERQRTQH